MNLAKAVATRLKLPKLRVLENPEKILRNWFPEREIDHRMLGSAIRAYWVIRLPQTTVSLLAESRYSNPAAAWLSPITGISASQSAHFFLGSRSPSGDISSPTSGVFSYAVSTG